MHYIDYVIQNTTFMKKIFFAILCATCLCSTSAKAQQNLESDGLEFPHKVITNGFWDNWFIGAGGGVNLFAGDHDQHISVGDRLAPSLNAYVGKWFTPGLAIRATYSGLYWKGASLLPESDFTSMQKVDGYYRQKGNFVNIHADAMFNLSELIGGHRLDRVYSFIPYVGAGIIHSTSTPLNDELSLHAGIINRFRVTDRLGVNLELSGTWFKDRFDGEVGGKKVDGLGNVVIGLSYRLGKNGFDRNIIKFTGISKSVLDNANEQANNLRMENARLVEENDKLREANKDALKNATAQIITRQTVAPVYVLFDLGKSSLNKEQRINLKYAAEAIKSCPKQVFVLEGYADNATGSPETNMRLSAERTKSVKKCLVEEFGVPENQLRIEIKGGVDNMFYNDAALSRAVIIKN